MMDKLAIEAVRADGPRRLSGRRAARRCWSSSTAPSTSARRASTRSSRICERCGSDDVRVARDEAERQLFWKTRKAAFAAMGRISPELLRPGRRDPAHASCPRCSSRIDELGRGVRHAGRQRLPRRRRQPAPAGLLRRRACEGEAERAEELSGLILDACLEAGGSITGEHGVGVDKKKHMPKMFAEADLDAFQRLRCAFDPDGLANPGKVMPTPRLCGEVPGPYRQHPLEAAGLAERF